MKRLMTIVMFLITVFLVDTFAQDQPEKKYYGIISGSIEYKKPGVYNEKIVFYFEEYGNYISEFSYVTYSYDPNKNFTFTFVYNPECGYIFFSKTDKGNRITSQEYPLIYNYNKKVNPEKLELSRTAYITFLNNSRKSHEEILLGNMRGFIRLIGGNEDSTLEKKMNERGFFKKGNSKVLNRDCIDWEKNNEKEEKVIKVSTWKGIALQWKEMIKGNLVFNQIAENINEEEVISYDKFDTPAGMIWDDWPKKEK